MQAVFLLAASYFHAMGQDKIIRKPLLTAVPINRMVKRVEVKEINFIGSQKTGLHEHPCPVVGYIVEGNAIFQIKGTPVQTLKAGDAFFEPANTPIEHFDNASEQAPTKFIAYYLLND